MNRSLQVLTLAAGALLATSALADSAAKAPVDVNKLVTTCAACHGKNGHSKLDMYPNLAGQYNDYLEHALKAYRSGERKNPIMGAQAKNLTDAQIKALANYFANQPAVVYTPTVE